MTTKAISFTPEVLKAKLRALEEYGIDRADVDKAATCFLVHLRYDGKPGCWEWRRSDNGIGYGRICLKRRTWYAHRIMFLLAGGSLVPGMDVMHSCDNPACVNPAHLELGTRSQNMAACHRRGRSRIPVSSFPGILNPAAKITPVIASEIRAACASGMRQRDVAKRHGISQTHVSDIVRGKYWPEGAPDPVYTLKRASP